MRTISSLLAVAVSSTGLIVACGGGLGSPSDSLLGNDPLPNSGDPAGSSTDPSGSSTDPTGGGSCVCPVGVWDCGKQVTLDISLKDGVCISGKTPIDACSGKFSADGLSGTILAKGSGVQLCVGSTCLTCKADIPTTIDASIPDMGVKDTSLPDIGVKDVVAKDAPALVCTSFCTANSDCESTCPAAGTGNLNCCDSVSTNACFVFSGSTCP